HLALLQRFREHTPHEVRHIDVGREHPAHLLRIAGRGHASAEAVMTKIRIALTIAGLALILLLANWDIAQKRSIVADGRALLLELRPADPRSLFQGDYMALALANDTM